MKNEALIEETQPVKPNTPATPTPFPSPRKGAKKQIVVGFDLGTNTSCILAGARDSTDFTVSKVVPTVVGYVRDGVVNGILPDESEAFFADKAIENKLHLDLVWPLDDGVVSDLDATRDFLLWAREQVDPSGEAEIRAVIGIPANADEVARKAMRQSVTNIFSHVLLIPEPFLAALGFRDDSRLGQKNYVDPVTNSLFIDIGAGTTDLCLVQGYFPKPQDQISLPFAGNFIDKMIESGLQKVYPDLKLSQLQIREIKENHSYVGASRRPIDQRVIVGGKGYTIEVADIVGDACNQLFDKIYESLQALIQRASSDSVKDLLQNIIITGGGSQVKGIDTVLQERMVKDGYENPRVRTAGTDYKRFVGCGAIKAARAARENQWQVVFN